MAEAVNREKSKTQTRRFVNVMGPLAGLLLFGAMRAISMEDADVVPPRKEGPYSFLFGDTYDWPWYMKHVWPVEMVVSVVAFWLMMRLVMNGVTSGDEPKGWRGSLKFGLGAAFVLGCFGWMLGTNLGGWYIGVEFFFLLPLMMLIFISGLAAVMGVMFGAGWVLKILAEVVWERVRFTRVGFQLQRVADFFTAADIPEAQPAPEERKINPGHTDTD